MALWQKKPKTKILARHTSQNPFFPGEHLLFRLENGLGRLCLELTLDRDQPDPMLDTFLSLTLDGSPLAFIQTSGSPTCQSMLAAGYGLPEDTPELRQAADAMAAPYAGLENALERLAPVTGLLPSGRYCLSRVDCWPTDGRGRFFWDIPNGYVDSPATAQIYDPGDYSILPYSPCFLHPTQSDAKYDPRRVEEYRERIRAGEALPPALAWLGDSYLCILLDGHHRACACTLEGIPLPCLVLSASRLMGKDHTWHIIWPDGATSPIPEVPVPAGRRGGGWDRKGKAPEPGNLFTRSWEGEYRCAANGFPTCLEAAALALYRKKAPAWQDVLDALADSYDSYSPLATPAALRYFLRQAGSIEELKAMAFSVAGKEWPMELRREAFTTLGGIPGDPEIEDFFVDYLVECEDPRDPLRMLADHYWDD